MANFKKYSYKINNKKTTDVTVNDIDVSTDSAAPEQVPLRRKKEQKEIKVGTNMFAYIGIILIIFSFISKPFYFAIGGYSLGIISYIKGSRKLGIMVVALSICSLLVQYFLGMDWF